MPKARPRVSRNGAYLPKRYRDWKDQAMAHLTQQAAGIAGLPLTRTTVAIKLSGTHRGDLDNLAGAILDALVQAKILQDDRLSIIPHLSISYHPDHPHSEATITLYEPKT